MSEFDDFLGSVQLEVESLIQGRQIGDPRLYDAILLLNKQLENVSRVLSPVVRKSLVLERGLSDLAAPVNFQVFSSKNTVRFTWDHVTFASQYEVREGTNWDTALFRFRTTGLQGDIDPLLYGVYNFLIKTLDSSGNYSVSAAQATFSVPQILAPTITVSVIDNNVLLYWTEPISTFKIDYYLVDKFGDSEAEGRVDGTFTSIFEVVAGVYTYVVTAVDIAGNRGASASIEAEVNTPPDFALQDTRISALNGTRDDVLRLSQRPSLLACWDSPQTWQEHFQVRHSWINIAAQLAAGYPIYIQPADLDGWYEEVVDYGLLLHNTIVTITWNSIEHTLSTVSTVVKMAVSPDGVSYTAFTLGASQYFRDIRYLKFRLEFTAEDDKALLELFNLTISLNVKRENDGGEIAALSTDVGGTTVNFNKAFRDIESITATTKSTTEPFQVIFDFVDIPDPVFFKVYVFDTMGARVSKTVDWKARGIV